MAHLLTRKRCAVGADFRRRSIGAALARFGNQSVFVLQPHVLVKGSRNQCGFLFSTPHPYLLYCFKLTDVSLQSFYLGWARFAGACPSSRFMAKWTFTFLQKAELVQVTIARVTQSSRRSPTPTIFYVRVLSDLLLLIKDYWDGYEWNLVSKY